MPVLNQDMYLSQAGAYTIEIEENAHQNTCDHFFPIFQGIFVLFGLEMRRQGRVHSKHRRRNIKAYGKSVMPSVKCTTAELHMAGERQLQSRWSTKNKSPLINSETKSAWGSKYCSNMCKHACSEVITGQL